MAFAVQQLLVKMITIGIVIGVMSHTGNAQEIATTVDDMLGCLHDGLVLGIDEEQLQQIAPLADNTPSPGRVAVPGVYVEMRDLSGQTLGVADRFGKAFGVDLSIGEAIHYYFENHQLVRVHRAIRIDPLGNTLNDDLVKKIRHLLNTAEMKMTLFGTRRYPTLRVTNDDQSMFVRFKTSGQPTWTGGEFINVEIEVLATRLARNNQLVDLSGRDDHEVFARFGAAFEEKRSP